MTVWMFVLIVIVILKKLKVFDRSEYLKKKTNNYYETNFWNGILDTICQGYLVLAVASFI